MAAERDLNGEVRRIAGETLLRSMGGDLELPVRQAIQRMDEPLRVAIAGRTKAGKSTLLNALVGERLAATDAGECTRIVTWYRRAPGYSVSARLTAGQERELAFRRAEGVLDIDLGGLDWREVERIEVGWPSERLAPMTLIDTPGLSSADDEVSARTGRALLDDDLAGPGRADAVIYLMRHLHRHDAQFLEAFVDRSLAHASPINSIVVLSRADEIGAGRPDALDSARSVAARYAGDRRIRELAPSVLPVAGLIAETGATLRESQFAALRELAALDDDARDRLLRSVDRFRDPERNPLTPELRQELLDRLGLFGVRTAVAAVASGRAATATALSRTLLELSGIGDLQRTLAHQFSGRAAVLKARSALAALRGVVGELRRRAAPGSLELETDLERLESGSRELAELRLLHLVMAGLVDVTPEERLEIERLAGSGSARERLGADAGAPLPAVRRVAIEGIERWRRRAANPLADRQVIEAAEIIIRAYERLHAEAV
ncbi:MAG TPA: GTPase [Candidatus Limnocylindrales bacterium]